MNFFLLTLSILSFSAWSKIDIHDFYSERLTSIILIDKKLSELGFSRFNKNRFQTNRFVFDAIYFNLDLSQAILIKGGILIENFEDKSDSLFSFKSLGTDFLAITLNLNKSHLYHLKNLLNDKKVSSIPSFISQAYAEDCPVSSSSQPLSSINKSIEDQNMRKKIGSCLDHAMTGAADAIRSQIEMYKKILTNPSALIKEAKETFEVLKVFLLNLESEIKMAINGINHLPEKVKLDVVCEMASSTGVLITQSLFLGPTQLVKQIPLLLSKLKKMNKRIDSIMNIDKKFLSETNKSILLKEAISCAK